MSTGTPIQECTPDPGRMEEALFRPVTMIVPDLLMICRDLCLAYACKHVSSVQALLVGDYT